MFLNSWSIALTLINLLSLFLIVLAGRTAFRVLFYWDIASDSNFQIQLENETWLASTLVQYALGFQIISLIVFALAADGFSEVIVGAMCATGALTSNSFGMPALFLKLFAVFLYALWIVLHHIDISSENYPLLKIKYIFLIALIPVLVIDIVLQTLYISGLEPDIITSCCAVVFSDTKGSMNLMGAIDREKMLPLFYGTTVVLFCLGGGLLKKWLGWLSWLMSLTWVFYFALSLLVITAVFSSFIYAMPYHRCPFCILKPEYYYIGFVMYGTLIAAVFFGVSQSIVNIFIKNESIRHAVIKYQIFSLKSSLVALVIFVVVSSYHYVAYRYWGGEM